MPDSYHNAIQTSLSYEAITSVLFETYESIYAVDAETSAYQCFHESDSYHTLKLEHSGDDFFAEIESSLLRTIYPEDQSYVRARLTKEALREGLKDKKYYSLVYRLVIGGKPLYHKLRATRSDVNRRPHFLIGIRNVDEAFRLDMKQAEDLSAMRSKESNHLEAVLASAEGYLEANLTKDLITELSDYVIPEGLPKNLRFPTLKKGLSYSGFEKWRIDNLIVENKEKYIEISDRNYLIGCFNRGEKRASVSFSMRTASGIDQPCRKIFYLYRNAASGDILAFCVIYDLTEQQRREKELRDLERELELSRIRNSTSQMQPHFLYNVLGSIQEIVLEDPEYASRLIGDFTMHLRSCIRAMENDSPIPFKTELANIRAYSNIEKMRFGEKLRIIYDIRVEDFSILPLSVQPLVENAIRHGIYERGDRGGTVRIRTAETDSAWLVTVEDDGVGFDAGLLRDGDAHIRSNSTGLKNIIFRLDKVMHASVAIESSPGVGTVVTLTLPKHRGKGGT
jgi:anti-sigma regulatory factor (Ser/Thr protein kinase)